MKSQIVSLFDIKFKQFKQIFFGFVNSQNKSFVTDHSESPPVL